MYDGSNFIKSSVNLNKKVVYAAVNYRCVLGLALHRQG